MHTAWQQMRVIQVTQLLLELHETCVQKAMNMQTSRCTTKIDGNTITKEVGRH
jgi:hypothetical protein